MVLGFLIGISYLFLDIIYWIKYFICLDLLWLKKITQRRRFDLYDYDTENQPEKLGILIPKEEIILESPIPEEELSKISDEVFFYGVNSKSETLVVRLTRITKEDADASIFLKLADGRWYHLEQTRGYQRNFDEKCKAYTCGGLKIYSLSAMRRWRIAYCGMLRERTNADDKEKKTAFVKFTFIWTASSDVYDIGSDFDIRTAADGLAQAKWNSLIPPVHMLNKVLNGYCQSGVLNGTVSVENEPEAEIYLFGERIKCTAQPAFLEGTKIRLILGVVPETGLTLHVYKASIPYVFHNMCSGFIVNPSSKIDVIQDAYIISNMSERDTTKENLTVMFKAGEQYELRGKFQQERIYFTPEEMEGMCVQMIPINFEIAGFKGSGIMISADISKLPAIFSQMNSRQPQIVRSPINKSRPLTVFFTDEESHFSNLTGGKGASLGKLTHLSSQMQSEFIVPKGIVVTTAAYHMFLTPEILKEILEMKNIVYGNMREKIHEACKMVQRLVESTVLPNEIQRDIQSKLISLFGTKVNQMKFAVRSSAKGEDSDEISAAGQMETFLGVQGLKEIFAAIKKCWASQFSNIAIEYKRQNGQLLHSSMAVVIQEMVECESSGVMFTCDPVTNNPLTVVITSNYGLGESVVSGTEEPDTIVLKKLPNDDVETKSINIGLKQHKIILSDSSENNTTTIEDVPEDKQNECSITETMTVSLGRLSRKIENFFKSPRDIEWGIKDNVIYILQCRPVTTGETLSDFEIKHEIDGPLRCEGDYFTTCNVGEVLPGPISTLGFDVFNRTLSMVFQTSSKKRNTRSYFQQSKYYPTGLVPFYNWSTLGVINLLTNESDDLESLPCQGMMLSIFGRILNDPDLREKVKQRKCPPKRAKIMSLLQYLWKLFFSGYGIEEMKEKVFNYTCPALKGMTSRETFELLMQSCSHPAKPFDQHVNCSMASSSWNIFLFTVLANAKGGIDNDVYSDFAKLLASSTNVESADIPTAMQFLAQAIIKDIKIEAFKRMSVEDAQKWLETSSALAAKKYREFIKRHGHRRIKELDIHTIPWHVDPKPLIKLLQNIAGTCEEVKSKKERNFSSILPKLTIPLNLKSRLLLKFILPNCRREIRNRENCKSIVVKAFDNTKKGFDHLSEKMVAEGYSPDRELIYFMTLDEINDLLDSRNPRTIARAKHRKRLFPYLNSLSFPEISKGRPVPINEFTEEPTEYKADLTMKGIPVSQGVAKGFARVALSLEEAADLKTGEILITKGTDIGWSPYFPILSGLVTELGGLISHGAVISREYGLPCIVGIHGATRQFFTGDYVLLDGNKGILERLPPPEI